MTHPLSMGSHNRPVVATQIFHIFTTNLGEMESNLTVAYFSNGLVQPPTRLRMRWFDKLWYKIKNDLCQNIRSNYISLGQSYLITPTHGPQLGGVFSTPGDLGTNSFFIFSSASGVPWKAWRGDEVITSRVIGFMPEWRLEVKDYLITTQHPWDWYSYRTNLP